MKTTKLDLDAIDAQARASMADLEALDPYHEDDISDDDHPAGRVLLQMPYVAEVTMANHADSYLGVERDATGPCRSIRFWREADATFFADARRHVLALVARVRELETEVAKHKPLVRTAQEIQRGDRTGLYHLYPSDSHSLERALKDLGALPDPADDYRLVAALTLPQGRR